MIIEDQPAPVPNGEPSIHDLVIAELGDLAESGASLWARVAGNLAERKRLGLLRYGCVLQAHNGRDALVDLYQEALDAVVYARQALEERRADWSLYASSLDHVAAVRRQLDRQARIEEERDERTEAPAEPPAERATGDLPGGRDAAASDAPAAPGVWPAAESRSEVDGWPPLRLRLTRWGLVGAGGLLMAVGVSGPLWARGMTVLALDIVAAGLLSYAAGWLVRWATER